MKPSEHFQQVIKAYLDKRREEDELFAEKYPNENISIEQCCTFIIQQVKETGRCGFADDEIYSLAVHAYDEPQVVKGGDCPQCAIAVNKEIQLTEEEKAEPTAKPSNSTNKRSFANYRHATPSPRLQRRKKTKTTPHYLICLTMRPKTEFQKQVVASSAKLRPNLPRRVMQWAKKNALNHFAYRLANGKTTCLDCGHTWNTLTNSGKTTIRCPHCHTKVELRQTLSRTHEEKNYFSYITTCQGLQVVRSFLLSVKYSKTEQPKYDCVEICQHWISPQGQVEVMGLRRTIGYYQDTFSYSSPIELRQDTDVYRHVANCTFCPYMNVLPLIKRNGFYGEFGETSPVSLFEAILRDSRIETLMKQHDLAAVSHFMHDTKSLNNHWQSYKIAQRNHYHIEDYSIWSDLLCLLERNGKDIRSPHYICPADLQIAHDHWLRKNQERIDREKSEEERKKSLAMQAEFEKMKGKFFGLVFTDNLLTVSVLETVQAHYDEGNAMHHCVGSMGYYNHPDSLIFSARINGKRIETVELSLKSMKVVQSRGLCNKNTMYHNRIVNLVNANVPKVVKRMTV